MEASRALKVITEVIEVLHLTERNETDLGKLKTLFKECAELRVVPHNERLNVTYTQLCRLMQLREVKEGDVLLQDNNLSPDLFIVLTGQLSSTRRGKIEASWRSFQALGDLEQLTGEIWEPLRVACTRSATLVVIKRSALQQLMQRIRSAMDKARMIEFLSSTVPGMRQLGQSSKEKIATGFEQVKFKPKTRILREKKPADSAYIINTGQCLEYSEDNSLPTRGLASKTMSQFNFGLVTKGQWIGEESILFDSDMPYSVITTSDVHAYKILRIDLSEKLGKEILNLLREQVIKKINWRESRKSLISNTFSPYLTSQYQEPFFPSGTPAVKHRIRQLQHQREISASPQYQGISVKSVSTSFSSNQSMEKLPGTDISPVRPSTTSSNFSLNFWFSQLPKAGKTLSNFRPNSELEGRQRLHFANTLGATMVPGIPKIRKKLERRKGLGCTTLKSGSVKDHFGYTLVETEDEFQTYSEKLNKKRVPSPNPMEAVTIGHRTKVCRFNALKTQTWTCPS